MNRPIYLISLLLTLAIALSAFMVERYRWEIKLLVDKYGKDVLELPAEPTTVYMLNALPRPSSAELHMGRHRMEMKKVELVGEIIADGLEEDGDIHLVIASADGNGTLIAEIPDPNDPLLSGHASLRIAFERCRAFVLTHLDKHPGHVRASRVKLMVRITGVPFFDKISHGNGHAINGIELHPVLDMQEVH